MMFAIIVIVINFFISLLTLAIIATQLGPMQQMQEQTLRWVRTQQKENDDERKD